MKWKCKVCRGPIERGIFCSKPCFHVYQHGDTVKKKHLKAVMEGKQRACRIFGYTIARGQV